MKRWIIVTGTVGVLAVVAVGLGGWSRAAVAESHNPPSEAAGVTLNEVKALREEVELLKRQAALAPAPSPAPGSPAPAGAFEPENTTSEERERQARERARQALVDLEARFASEPVDAAWSVQTVREIRDIITRGAAGTEVVEAECGSTLCRVVVKHETEEAQKNLASKVSAEGPFRPGVAYDYDYESVPRKTTLLVIREGHSFRAEDPSP